MIFILHVISYFHYIALEIELSPEDLIDPLDLNQQDSNLSFSENRSQIQIQETNNSSINSQLNSLFPNVSKNFFIQDFISLSKLSTLIFRD